MAISLPGTVCTSWSLLTGRPAYKGNMIVKTGCNHSLNKTTWAFVQLTASAKGKLCLEHSARNPKKAECLFCHNTVRLYMAKYNQRHDGKYCSDSCRGQNRSWWKSLQGKNLPMVVAVAGRAHFRLQIHSMTLQLQAETVLWVLTLCVALYWLLNTHYLVSFLKQVCVVYIINPGSQMREPQETVLNISVVEWPRTVRLEKLMLEYLLFCAS